MNEAFDDIIDIVRAEPTPAAKVWELAPLRSAALAELSAVDRGIAALRAEHGSTAYDITTPHGYKLASTRRHAIRLVRYEIPKVVKARKADLKEIADAVTSEAERITAALRAIEDPHDRLIESEDLRKRQEKEARERAEAEAREVARLAEEARKAKHLQGIATIKGYVAMAHGLTSAQLAAGVRKVGALCDGFVPAVWEEFATEAKEALHATLMTLMQMHVDTLAREKEAARVEAQRVENERIAAELEAQKRRQQAEADRLAAERAEFERVTNLRERLQSMRAMPAGLEGRPAATIAVAIETLLSSFAGTDWAEFSGEATAARQAALDALQAMLHAAREFERIEAERAAPVIVEPDVPTVEPVPGTSAPAAEPAEPAAQVAVLSVSALSQRLELPMTAALLKKLGFEPFTTDKRAVLYRASDLNAICDALIAHVNSKKD